MPKLKTVYVCSSCGTQQSKWSGSCDNCQEWNTLVEDVIDVSKPTKKAQKAVISQLSVRKLSEIDHEATIRRQIGIKEFDRVLGGGLVPGALVLLAGEPGIGKSTLMLQTLGALKDMKSILYIAGEESVEQIGLRAKRLGLELGNVDFLSATELTEAMAYLENNEPEMIVVDSVSVLYSQELGSFAGSIPQVRAVTEAFRIYAKATQVPVIMIGHVTKQGSIAGPRVMEHMVDVVLQLEGDRFRQIRLLRGIKNRFGSTQEVGMFEMVKEGLEQVKDPGAKLLSDRQKEVVGSALTITVDGNRPFLVEVQALVTKSHFGYPKRTANGFDINRLNLVIAVLERHYGLKLGEMDIFVNVIGGIKIKEPGCDLAVLEAIKSSYTKKALDGHKAYIGEIGLDGKVRAPFLQAVRSKEARNTGVGIV